jgi:hypothetical protein
LFVSFSAHLSRVPEPHRTSATKKPPVSGAAFSLIELFVQAGRLSVPMDEKWRNRART